MARETHDLGRLYTHGMNVPRGGPLVELGTSHEVEEPWRVGRCVVLRVWKWAAVLGWWGPARTREEMEAEERRIGAGAALQYTKPMIDQIREDFRPEQHDLLPDEYRIV